MTEGLKLYRVSIKNIGGAPSLVFAPEGKHAQIVGPNGSGKSRVLDAIVSGITGRGHNLSVDAEEGEIEIELGRDGAAVYRIDRRIRRGKTPSLVVRERGKDGWGSVRGPAAFLKDLVDAQVAFDPIAWDRMTPVEKRLSLLRAAKVDIARFDRLRADAYSRRTEVGRDLRRVEATLESMEIPAVDLPADPVSTRDLGKDLATLITARNNLSNWQGRMTAATTRITDLERELTEAKDARDRLRKQRPPEVSEDAIAEAAQAIEDIEATNAKIAHAARFRAAADECASLTKEVADLNETIERIEREKVEALEASGIGIDGLSITDDDITVGGVSVANLNHAKRIELGMKIRAASEPRLRFALVDDGSELGEAARAALYRIADQHGLQVLLTRVNDDDAAPLEFLLVDGSEAE